MKVRWLPLLLLLPQLLVAGEFKASEDKMKTAIHAAVTGQLEAFRIGDYAAAYGYAAPEFKEMFPVEAFERMVKMSYPAIAHSVSVSFGLTFDNGEEAVVNVNIVGEDKATARFQYTLKRDGQRWRITGVSALEKQGLEV